MVVIHKSLNTVCLFHCHCAEKVMDFPRKVQDGQRFYKYLFCAVAVISSRFMDNSVV